MTLRLASPLTPPLLSHDSGPGCRWLLFLQGCATPCTTRCLNPRMLSMQGGQSVSRHACDLAVDIVASGRFGAVEGITLLGGEPTDQADDLLPFVRSAKAAGLSIMLYSGRTRSYLEEQARPAIQTLVSLADLLVDGPFLPHLADPNLVWRGSSNQRIHRIGHRYATADLQPDQERRGVTLHLPTSGRIGMNGLQHRDAAAAVEQAWHGVVTEGPGPFHDA